MIRPIVQHPDPLLHTTSEALRSVSDDTRALLDDMLETMYSAQGRGLAGVQVGALQRVVVVDITWKEGAPDPMVFVDPEIVWMSEAKAVREERCLSIPDRPTPVERSTQVRVRYLDRDGVPQEREFEGLMALVMQHEVDHLDGVATKTPDSNSAGTSPSAADQLHSTDQCINPGTQGKGTETIESSSALCYLVRR